MVFPFIQNPDPCAASGRLGPADMYGDGVESLPQLAGERAGVVVLNRRFSPVNRGFRNLC
jgi:hypothetical protein